jgi:hypothetical protein
MGFAVVGLTTAPWRADEAARPAPVGATVSVERGAAIARGTPAPAGATAAPSAEDGSDAPAPASGESVAEPAAPPFRLPEELAPVAPDIVVALPPAHPEGIRLPVLGHAHVADGADDEARVKADAIAAQAGDDFQGPEPGAVYWFGPRGLERVRTSEEARR